MSIFDKLIDRATGMRRRNTFHRPPVDLEIRDESTGKVRDYTLDSNEEFAITAAVTVTYWANKAQRTHARRNAEHVLASFLYRDVHEGLSEVRHAIMDGDANEAMDLIGKLESRLSP